MSKVQLEILTNIDMLLMVKKEQEEAICHLILRHARPSNLYMKHNETKGSLYLTYSDKNNFYGLTL